MNAPSAFVWKQGIGARTLSTVPKQRSAYVRRDAPDRHCAKQHSYTCPQQLPIGKLALVNASSQRCNGSCMRMDDYSCLCAQLCGLLCGVSPTPLAPLFSSSTSLSSASIRAAVRESLPSLGRTPVSGDGKRGRSLRRYLPLASLTAVPGGSRRPRRRRTNNAVPRASSRQR